jgi:hypothetical protein
MADERMICSQQSNNWYHFVNWPGYPETYGLQCLSVAFGFVRLS